MRDVPTWSRYFMSIAEAVASRSKDPSTQVGCVVTTSDNRIISTGYNGMAPGMREDDRIWERPQKYNFVIHAEVNALGHARGSVEGATLYCTHKPCSECAKAIVAHGISRVRYDQGEAKMLSDPEHQLAFDIFTLGSVRYRAVY